MGAKKYGRDSWKYGRHFDSTRNHMSILGHTLRSLGLAPIQVEHLLLVISDMSKMMPSYFPVHDHESGLHDLKHVATRALMEVYLDEEGVLEEEK